MFVIFKSQLNVHGSLEDHFLVIRIPWSNKVITYLLTYQKVCSVKSKSRNLTYLDQTILASRRTYGRISNVFLLLDCKTVGFFSKSVKKSVKRGVRVLRARSTRASHASRACEARAGALARGIFLFFIFLASLASLALCFQLRSRPRQFKRWIALSNV